jgi:hypothetical protein
MPIYWWRVVRLRDGTKLYFCEPTSRGRLMALGAPYAFAPLIGRDSVLLLFPTGGFI